VANPASTTLAQERAVFAAQRSPRIIAFALIVAVVVRLAAGGYERADLVVVAVILGLEPLTEWLIHVLLLHFRPRQLGRVRLDPFVARKHRAHHADPRDRDLVFVPPRVLVVILPIAAVAFPLLLPTPRLGATAAVTSFAMLLTYEWTHHLIHSTYRPRRRYYRSIWRAHRLHHFRNEHYWFGVTVNLADHVLGTFPDRDAVPVSPTARTLGVSDASPAA